MCMQFTAFFFLLRLLHTCCRADRVHVRRLMVCVCAREWNRQRICMGYTVHISCALENFVLVSIVQCVIWFVVLAFRLLRTYGLLPWTENYKKKIIFNAENRLIGVRPERYSPSFCMNRLCGSVTTRYCAICAISIGCESMKWRRWIRWKKKSNKNTSISAWSNQKCEVRMRDIHIVRTPTSRSPLHTLW